MLSEKSLKALCHQNGRLAENVKNVTITILRYCCSSSNGQSDTGERPRTEPQALEPAGRDRVMLEKFFAKFLDFPKMSFRKFCQRYPKE